MTDKSYYEILGVPPTANFQEIKKAYRSLAKQHHPDKTAGDASPEQQAYFTKINEAYAVLSNLHKRQQYDAARAQRQNRQEAPPFASAHAPYAGYPYFRYDIFTPYIHSFFMGGKEPPKTKEDGYRAVLLNHKILLLALLGTLYFFKFFTAYEGTVIDKTEESGSFVEKQIGIIFSENTYYYLILETGDDAKSRRRVKEDIYEKVKKGDSVKKTAFSFTVIINNEEITTVDLPRFLLQFAAIYIFISGTLLFLEYAR